MTGDRHRQRLMVACAPAALPSCSIVPRSPDSTSPPGRLQFDLRVHQLGGLFSDCQDGVGSPILGPDGQPLRGVGVNIYGHPQTASDPTPERDCYVNPLKVTADNELYVDRDWPVQFFRPVETCQSIPGRDVVWSAGAGRLNLDETFGMTVTNETCVVTWLERWVTINSWEILDPPSSTTVLVDPLVAEVVASLDDNTVSTTVDTGAGTGSGTVDNPEVSGTVSITRQNIDDLSSPEAVIRYWLDVNGQGFLVGSASTGQVAAGTQTIRLPIVNLQPGQADTTTIQAYLQPRDSSRVPNDSRSFGMFPGQVCYSARLHTTDINDVLFDTPATTF